MAFMLFAKRRRDGDPTDNDEALAAAAATGVAAVASSALVGSAPDPLAAPPPTTSIDAEMAMPRWRRPSLLEARKADPMRMATTDVKLTFDHGFVDAVDGRERRLIRYRVVRLLDRPDELTGLDVGVLDAGDEVQLMEKSGVYWYVLCPDGQQGWVHKMVLGEVVEQPDLPGPAARATGPRASVEASFGGTSASIEPAVAAVPAGGAEPGGHDPTLPGPAWTLRGSQAPETSDVDEDVLQAYLAARGRG
jgi:hypothetical protein